MGGNAFQKEEELPVVPIAPEVEEKSEKETE